MKTIRPKRGHLRQFANCCSAKALDLQAENGLSGDKTCELR